MVVIFDMNTGEIFGQEAGKSASEEPGSVTAGELETAVGLQEVESTAATPDQEFPPVLRNRNAGSFLDRMAAKRKCSR